MKLNRFIAVGSVFLVMIIMLVVVRLMDWTPKEEKVANHEAAYEAELIELSEQNVTSATVIEKPVTTVVPETKATTVLDSESPVTTVTAIVTQSLVNDTVEEGTVLEDAAGSQVTSEANSEPVQLTMDSQGSEVKDQWVQDAIDRNRDQISEADLEAGAIIYNRLDTLYLLDLADGGLTEEEKTEVEHYLDSVLTDEERAIAWELYNRYIHLLNE